MKEAKRRGMMLILSSPSGVGKTTLANMILSHDAHICPSVSYTTRGIRDGETDGKNYFFITEAEFRKHISDDFFLEYAEVFGHYYGTSKPWVEKKLLAGEDVLFDIEWQGHRALKKLYGEDVVSIFILPPSKKELYNRLKTRARDCSDTIANRMAQANDDLIHWKEYDYVIVNHNLDEAFSKVFSILRAERLRKQRRTGLNAFVNELIKETI